MKKLTSLFLILFIGYRANAQVIEEQSEPKVFTFVEQMPEFPGGDAGLVKFLSQNIVYPQMERDNDIQGRVLLRFIVMEDGQVDSVTVMRGVSPGLDREAVRVVKALPKFKPGTQQGKPVRVYFNLPIVYKLQNSNPKEDEMLKAKILKDENFRNAISLTKAGDNKGAIKELNKSIKKYPNDYFTYDVKAEVEMKMNNNKQACKDLEKALQKGSPTAAAELKKSCK